MTLATAPGASRKLLSPLRDFLHTEVAGGAVLVLATVAALVWANSPWSGGYERLWSSDIALTVAGHTVSHDLRHWVNDGLMTVFFLVVGLEIKRELTTGHLAGRRAAAAPVAAALGGMVVPALLYVLIAGRTAGRGWGVPMATDIALALAVVALAGARAPASYRSFLLGLAVVDDIGAILVIAVFYASGVSVGWLAVSVVAVLASVGARALGIHRLLVYVALGVVAWFGLSEGGVHPTLVGVALGLLAPSTPRLDVELIDVEELRDLSSVEQAAVSLDLARGSVSVVEWLQHHLHPWTSYAIVPLFALANAGVALSIGAMGDAVRSAVFWGIFVGLVVGKPLGVLVSVWVFGRTGALERPSGGGGAQFVGIGAAAGIGFTVALFIAELAFTTDAHLGAAKLAILAASVVSALVALPLVRLRGRGAST